MKRIGLLGLLVLVGIGFSAGGRHHDRDWSVTQVTVTATSSTANTTVTATQSGMLWIENHGADVYIAFGSIADATDIKIPSGGSMDFYPASITLGDTFTLFSAGNTSINYTILD